MYRSTVGTGQRGCLASLQGPVKCKAVTILKTGLLAALSFREDVQC